MRLSLRTCVVMWLDAMLAALSVPATFILLHGIKRLIAQPELFPAPMALVAALALLVLPLLGVYRNLWRYVSIVDMVRLGLSAVCVGALFTFGMWCFQITPISPASSFPLVHIIILFLMLGGARVLRRVMADRVLCARIFNRPSTTRHARTMALLAPLAEAEIFMRAQSLAHPATAFHITAIFTDEGASINRAVHGIPILPVLRLRDVLAESKTRPTRLACAASQMHHLTPDMHAFLSAQNILPCRLPAAMDVEDTLDAARLLRPINIADVLGRTQHVIDNSTAQSRIAGAVVMISGAGGSIGAELTRQIAAMSPAKLILLEHSEYALYRANTAAHEHLGAGVQIVTVLCDIRDERAVRAVMQAHRPEIVFHAAALKHVPIVEQQPDEGVRTNILGTQILAKAAQDHGVADMLMISTDKAVAPSSVMGATKRVAEQIIQAMDAHSSTTRFMSVRFGNVLGSSGSVVPLFERQIAAGGPVTLTHPDMTRYFMTIREAVGLVLSAFARGASGADPRGGVYVLDMGEPVRIMDLAAQMIRLSGRDVRIEITGLRAGEKLHEALVCDHETLKPTDTNGVMRAQSRLDPVMPDLSPLMAAVSGGDMAAVRGALAKMIADAQFKA